MGLLTVIEVKKGQYLHPVEFSHWLSGGKITDPKAVSSVLYAYTLGGRGILVWTEHLPR